MSVRENNIYRCIVINHVAAPKYTYYIHRYSATICFRPAARTRRGVQIATRYGSYIYIRIRGGGVGVGLFGTLFFFSVPLV